jgi:hypothetical protein
MNLDNMSNFQKTAQHSVHPTGGTLRVFKRFSWLEAGFGKVALSRPAHQRVTQAVGRLLLNYKSLIFSGLESLYQQETSSG